MKKLLFLIASLSLVLAACSSDKEEATDTKTTGATSTEEKANPAADMMNFYLSISQSINEVDADLNAFDNAQAKDSLPEGAELQTMRENAKNAAVNASAKVESLEIPAGLTEQQDAIEGALAKIQEAYTMKSEALAAEGEVVVDEANAKFQEADTELNAVLEEVGLVGSSIYNEVSL
ncbi:hypothetical protein [Paenisporosarcina indica]|uniref:hypothetical protein n=1 Tax=Paenisporosarcina indica TaxID=650093 RepID=UPI00095007CA|nr:hypothetical protein [Paenisporosarcina indica]